CDRLPKLGVDRVHPAELLDKVAERWSMGRGGEQFQRRWRLRLQLLVDIDNAEARVVAEIAGIRDERAAQHRVGALDCGRIAAAGLGRRAGQSTNIVAAG